MKLSIIIPAFNEKYTIETIINKVFQAPCFDLEKEIIVVNDGSTDGTKEILENFKKEYNFILINHDKNQGKGAAIHTGLKYVSGNFVLIQDADLEYNPDEYPVLLKPLINKEAEIIYGSRNLTQNPRFSFIYFVGSKCLNIIFNFLFKSQITDINTGYKVFKTDIIKNLNLEAKDFAFCTEVTAKIILKGYKIKEVPISYSPRDFKNGKKLKARDGIIELWTIIKLRFFSYY
jgi:glycosyltransferase involved in cell wall biosynthesis